MSLIFLSHSRLDDKAARELKSLLEADGYKAVFLDHDESSGIIGGEIWEERLYTELRRCRAMIALITADWLNSAWCVAEASYAQALRRPLIPLRLPPFRGGYDGRNAPPALRRLQPIIWDGSAEAQSRLTKGLIAAGLDPNDIFSWSGDRSPYPGLTAFQREDAAVFFGREQETTELLALLRECRAPRRPRLILVQGGSGTGKSSLLRAGVVPRIERDKANWIVVPPFRPTSNPLQRFADALTATTAEPDIVPVAQVNPREDGVATWEHTPQNWLAWAFDRVAVLRHARPGASVLFVIDQLEEALIPSQGLDGDAFLLFLRDFLAGTDHSVVAIATLRADFIPMLQHHAMLRDAASATGEILYTRAINLGPLSRSSFFAIIEAPARLSGLDLDPDLAPRLVEETRTEDGLPLLAFVLRELWDRYGQPNHQITAAQYRSFGGLEAAVGSRAEQIMSLVRPSVAELEAFRVMLVFGMAELSAEGQAVRRRLGNNLVPVAAKRLTEEFVHARLFLAEEDTIEVAHEALFRMWRDLSGWIQAAAEELAVQRRARDSATAWDVAGAPRGSLWRSPDLDLLRRSVRHSQLRISDTEASFLLASERQATRERWINRSAVGMILLLAAGAIIFGVDSNRQATLARSSAAEAKATLLKRDKIARSEMRAELEAAAALGNFVWQLDNFARVTDRLADALPEVASQLHSTALRRRSEIDPTLTGYAALLRNLATNPLSNEIEVQTRSVLDSFRLRQQAQLFNLLVVASGHAVAIRDNKPVSLNDMGRDIIAVPARRPEAASQSVDHPETPKSPADEPAEALIEAKKKLERPVIIVPEASGTPSRQLRHNPPSAQRSLRSADRKE